MLLRIHAVQGPLDIEPDLRSVQRGGRPESVRPKTLDVLLYLVNHRDRIVSKEDLLSALWPEVAVSDNVLVRSVLEIRRLLGDDPKSPSFIRTVARSGYQFVGRVEECPAGLPKRFRRPRFRPRSPVRSGAAGARFSWRPAASSWSL